MARNEHKKVLQQLSEAYQKVLNEGGQPAGGIRSFREKPPRMDAFAKAAFAKNNTGKRFKLVGVGGESGQIEILEGEFDTIDEVIEHIGPLRAPGGEYGNEWVEDIEDSRNWSAEGFKDGLLRFGIGGDYEVVDTQSVTDDGWDAGDAGWHPGPAGGIDLDQDELYG